MYAQIYRYRHVSTPTERQQTKWVLFGILLWYLLLVMLFVPYSFELNLPPGSPLAWWALVSSTGWWLTLTIVPLSLSIAVLRYRLYDIDLLINRTLVYGALTATLVALYFGGIVVLQRVFVLLAGHKSTLAVVASTLVIAALFSPLRRRIQSLIDRRFYREVRCEKDPRSLLRQAQGRDGPERLERRSGRGGERNYATGTRLAVATPRHGLYGPAGRLAAASSTQEPRRGVLGP
jgi:hypothetical protein